MAEQSIGMATGIGVGFGDGNGSGYETSRMIAMETKTLNNGVLQTGSLLAMTGNGTNTLTVAAGAAIVGGYFYENTTSAAIVITTLANATYNVVVFVNDTAGALTVSRSVSGTTVTTYAVRVAVCTSAQLVGRTYLQLGTVVISGSAITASGITQDYAMYGATTQLPYQSYAVMSGGTATLTTSNVAVSVANYSSSSVTADNLFSVNTTTGGITIQRTGLYNITFSGTFSTGTTGQRGIIVTLAAASVLDTRFASTGVSSHSVVFSANFEVATAGSIAVCTVFANIAAQSLASGKIILSRA
jgi:hypothetical protein